MISEMPLLQKRRAAFPQPSRAIYCGKVIISLYLKKWTGWAPVWMWALSLKPQRLMVALGVIFNFSSEGDIIDCKRAVKHRSCSVSLQMCMFFFQLLLLGLNLHYKKKNMNLFSVIFFVQHYLIPPRLVKKKREREISISPNISKYIQT